MQMAFRRLAAGMLAVLTVVSVGSRTGRAADDASFKAHCARCHQRAAILVRKLKGDTRDARAKALSAFLETHHCENPQARAAIVDYLVGLSPP
jgi:hypothetical protein